MIQLGLIGAGGIGRMHTDIIMGQIPGAEITAVNDISRENMKKVTDQYPSVKVFDDPHELIQSPLVDAVIVTTWDRTHEEFVVSAIKAGKYVFCEKPLADTAEACVRMMNEEMAAGKKYLTVGFMRRYDRGYVQVKEAIDSGCIGAPLLLHEQHRNAHPTGEKHTTDMSANGALVHEFDITRWLTGDEYDTAQLICPKSTRNADPDLIDPQMVILRTKTGIHADLEIYMNCIYGYDIHCEVVGEKGTASLPDLSNAMVRGDGVRGYKIEPVWIDRFADAYAAEMRDWVICVESGRLTGPDAWDGYAAAATAEACTKSRLSGGEIVKVEMIDKPEFYD